MLSKIIKLEDIKDGFVNNDNEGHYQSDMLDIGLFMQYTIDLMKNIIYRQEQLFGKVKKLEQAKKQKYHKYTKAELAYFNKPIPKAEKNDDAIVWFILSVISLSGVGYWVWTVMAK